MQPARSERAGPDAHVHNCIALQFPCPRRWADLEPTATAAVRACGQCRELVYYCGSHDEALDHARQGHCVALAGHDPTVMVGRPAQPYAREACANCGAPVGIEAPCPACDQAGR